MMLDCEENRIKAYFTNLGCPKNKADEGAWIDRLAREGFEIVDKIEAADFLFVNTCTFIEDARRESKEIIEIFGEIKRKCGHKKIVVTGCWAQKEKEKILDKYPFVDYVFGNLNIDESARFFAQNLSTEEKICHVPENATLWYPSKNLPNTFPYSYLKISEGCENFCSYCILPYVRQKFRSVPEQTLIDQAAFLVQNGYKELVVVAQDTTRYGTDLNDNSNLISLLHKLDSLDGDFLIRLMYLHPRRINRELISAISSLPKVAKYLDMPLQHYDDQILAAMNRGYDSKYIDKLIEEIFSINSDFTLRTTFIVGFPGETDEQFERLLNFVSREHFVHMGVFTYSLEKDTVASMLPNKVPAEVAGLRKELLQLAHGQFLREHNQNLVGKTFPAIVDSRGVRKDLCIARMFSDAPEVDRYVKLKGSFEPGTIVNVRIIAALSNQLLGLSETFC